MPNYIRNILKIESTPDKIQQVLKSIQSDTNPDQLLDFNKIIPMPKSLEITAGSQEDLTQLYMTYINPQIEYYGIQSNNDPIPTIKQNPFLPRYRDDLSTEEIEKMLYRFSNYSEEQCLQFDKQYYDNYFNMAQHPGITGVLITGVQNGMLRMFIMYQTIFFCLTPHGIILNRLCKRCLKCLK